MESAEKYQPYIIKEYPHWTLFLNQKQMPYVGQCYAWWKDNHPGKGEGMSPFHLTGRDLVEVFHMIYQDVLIGCKTLGHRTDRLGQGFRLNVAHLANEPIHNHQMHWHFVPRFAEPVRVQALLGRTFEDLIAHENYAHIKELALPHEELLVIRDTMAEAII
ncbi:MAG TPA: hypothetical protein VG934_01105 [Candidatus Paceibacterota bacterium]|nr:hypothetical protein [Candidatus Paceibacterota bacterium]